MGYRFLISLVLAATMLPMQTGFAQTAQTCAPGDIPTFQTGFQDLQATLGTVMGTPLDCAYADPNGSGDVEQDTTTGLAFWRQGTNTPSFTDGFNHWALTGSSLVTWTGSSIDPPRTTVATAASSDFSQFVLTWGGQDRSLDFQADGQALLSYRIFEFCGRGQPAPCDTMQGDQVSDGGRVTLRFTNAAGPVATGQIAASNDPANPVGAVATLTLGENDSVDLILDTKDFGLFCGPAAPQGLCGSSNPDSQL